jgi:hypothetical protein
MGEMGRGIDHEFRAYILPTLRENHGDFAPVAVSE